jgi:adenylate cyclase
MFKYGIIGDSVNVAARLEALNKEIGSTLLISESTFENMSTRIQNQFEGLGPYPVKGRQEPVNIFRLSAGHMQELSSISLELESINTFDWWD